MCQWRVEEIVGASSAGPSSVRPSRPVAVAAPDPALRGPQVRSRLRCGLGAGCCPVGDERSGSAAGRCRVGSGAGGPGTPSAGTRGGRLVLARTPGPETVGELGRRSVGSIVGWIDGGSWSVGSWSDAIWSAVSVASGADGEVEPIGRADVRSLPDRRAQRSSTIGDGRSGVDPMRYKAAHDGSRVDRTSGQGPGAPSQQQTRRALPCAIEPKGSDRREPSNTNAPTPDLRHKTVAPRGHRLCRLRTRRCGAKEDDAVDFVGIPPRRC